MKLPDSSANTSIVRQYLIASRSSAAKSLFLKTRRLVMHSVLPVAIATAAITGVPLANALEQPGAQETAKVTSGKSVNPDLSAGAQTPGTANSTITQPDKPSAGQGTISSTSEKSAKQKKSKKFKGDAPCLSWIDPSVTPWAAVLCIHGLGLNSDAYTALGQKMSPLGIATYAVDVRGFGSWMDAKGHKQIDFKNTTG